MNFEIGKKVIAINDHSQGFYKKDEIYPVLNLVFSDCCGRLGLDIGIYLLGVKILVCNFGCGDIYDYNGTFDAINFRPLEENTGEMFIEDFLEVTETIEI